MELLEQRHVEPATVPAAPSETACTAELAECTCPDFCERDHEND
jgi:hypothetical protein